MTTKTKQVNMAGLDIICNRIITGQTKPSQGEVAVQSSLTAGHIAGRRNVIALTAAARTLTLPESGSLVTLNKADGMTITLPVLSAAMLGTWYEFQALGSVTSVGYKWATGTQGTDFFNGSLVTADPDGSPAEATFIVTGNGTTHDNILMNGTTTGGLIGTCFRIVATSVTTWTVFGVMAASGDTATPFATS